jgi:hypothetical protein
MLLLLLACTDAPDTAPTDDTHDTGEITDTGPYDVDGDGFTADVDCDDADPLTHPDADEQPNGWDDNCDGQIDELVCTADEGATVLEGYSLFRALHVGDDLELGEITGLAVAEGAFQPGDHPGVLLAVEDGDSVGVVRLDRSGAFVDWLVEPGTLPVDVQLQAGGDAVYGCSWQGPHVWEIDASGGVTVAITDFGACSGMAWGDAGDGEMLFVSHADSGVAWALDQGTVTEALGIVADLSGLDLPPAESTFPRALYGLGADGVYTWLPDGTEDRPWSLASSGLGLSQVMGFGSGALGDSLYVLSWSLDRLQRMGVDGTVEDVVRGPFLLLHEQTPALVVQGDTVWFANEQDRLWRLTPCDGPAN